MKEDADAAGERAFELADNNAMMAEEPGMEESPDKPADSALLKPQNTLMRNKTIKEVKNATGDIEMVQIGVGMQRNASMPKQPTSTLLKRGTKISPRDEHSGLLD